MGVLSNNRVNLVPGALISSSYMSDIYDVLSGQIKENIVISGSLVVTGSSIITSGVTASLFGTSSWAITASYALNAASASYTSTIQYITSSSIADLAYTASYYNDSHLLPKATFNSLTSSMSVATASYYNDSHLLSTSTFNSVTSSMSVATASYSPKTDYLVIAVSDELNSLTTGSAKVTFRWPYSGVLLNVKSSLTTASSGSNVIVDININNSSILSTKLSIDSTEKTSMTAATPYVFSNTTVVEDDEVTIDIDQVGSISAGKGLKVYFKTLIS